MIDSCQIEQACKDNNHELIREILTSLDSHDYKEETFRKIINYYENMESRIPVGYYKLFIKWLSGKGDFETAGEYIGKIALLNPDQTRGLIYELVIKPDESGFRERFNENLELLRENRILISTHSFDFTHAVNNITGIKKRQPDLNARIMDVISKEKEVCIMALDVIDLDTIKQALKEEHLIYLVYNDLSMFYSVLLFEDLTFISRYAKNGKIVMFPGRDMEGLKRFFKSMKIIPPRYILAPNVIQKEYEETINEAVELWSNKYESYMEELKSYYKDMDSEYYRKLFNKTPANTKVILITSETTDLNKFIAKNWYEAFQELGYCARLLIQSEPYEEIHNTYIVEQICDFKPDMVFHINYPIESVFNEKNDIRKNLLWIMRYRDEGGVSGLNSENNMFVLPMTYGFNTHGMPENKLFTVPDGVNINLFSRKGKRNNRYTCDVTYVSNSGGGEAARLEYYVQNVPDKNMQKVIYDLYDDLKGNYNDEHVFVPVDFESYVDKKIRKSGMPISENIINYIRIFVAQIMEIHYRSKVIEWIIDAKITDNIKLWGKHWSNVDKFRNYHAGVAQHGDELAAIYENSSISISDVLWLHERNFEILSSGGFPLIRNTIFQESIGQTKITEMFKEDDEIVVFYSKEDLLNKIRFYLDNPEERNRIAERGNDLVKRNFSHTAITGRTMEFIKNFYEC